MGVRGGLRGYLGRISGYLKQKQPKTYVWISAVGEKEFCKGLGLFDANEWGVSVAATFGYRAKEITKKARKPIEEMVTWVE